MNGLRFTVFGFPVQVQPNFALLAGVFVLLGLSWGWSIPLIVGSVLMAAFSVLVHELGHASVARAFSLHPIAISLHGMGGMTTHRPSPTAWKELLVVLAGPAFGMLLALAALLLSLLPLPGVLGAVVVYAIYINVLWSFFNMLPIFPLDGGHALSSFLRLFLAAGVAWMVTFVVGLLGAIALGAWALFAQEMFILLFAGMFGYQNFQYLRQVMEQRSA